MQKSDDLRRNAERCAELAAGTLDAPEKKRLERLAKGWEDVATSQDWLDGEKPNPSNVYEQ